MKYLRFPHYRWKLLKQFVQRAIRRTKWRFCGLPEMELVQLVPEEVSLSPIILDDACMPPYHQHVNDHDDMTPLLKLVRHYVASVVVELGTAHGNTTANICRQVPAVRVYTVNAPVEKQTGALTTFKLTTETIGRVYRRHDYANQVVQILENTLSLDLSRYLDGRIVDLAIIDACHDTAYVLNDFEKVRSFMKPGGIVLFHDTCASDLPSHLDGSYNACIMLRKQGYDIRHLRGTWWGVWICR